MEDLASAQAELNAKPGGPALGAREVSARDRGLLAAHAAGRSPDRIVFHRVGPAVPPPAARSTSTKASWE
jgi:hypothetical protein